MKAILAGNWKMNKVADEASLLISELKEGLSGMPEGVDVVVSPAFPFLASAIIQCDRSRLSVAAQNCHYEDHGAFTGEVSVPMLKSIGVTYCIVGHSERRQYYAETDESVGLKMKALITEGITPIYCCGEQEAERRSEKQFEVVERQLDKALSVLSENEKEQIVVAYEPVWAIGTGLTATAEQAQEMHAFIRKQLGPVGDTVPILYGGSCKPSNADEIFACSDVNGGLIGGASLNAGDFLSLLNSLHKYKGTK